jgi:hypothetical protein
MPLPNKYFIQVGFTKHAEDRIKRYYGVSKDAVIKDIRQEIYNTCKERGVEKYKLTGRIGKYIFYVHNRKIWVITVLYRKDKRKNILGRSFLNLDKEEIKNIFAIK